MMKHLFLSLTAVLFTIFFSVLAAPVAAQNGMTWTKVGVHDITGAVSVGCGYESGVGNQCNPYYGDTDCSRPLPVLCFNDAGLEQPSSLDTSPYHQWSGGIIATTPLTPGNAFNNVDEVNQYCESEFGKEWRVAEFHDGWGWYFWAYGNVGSIPLDSNERVDSKFHDGWGWYLWAYDNVGSIPLDSNELADSNERVWVNIDDQPNGTCWTQ